MVLQKNHVQFFTAVCYDWLKLLDSDEAKLIVIESLKFRIAQGQVKVGAYVIMPNHIHIIWRIQNDFKLEDVQRDFLKFTAKKIIERIWQRDGQKKLEEIYVGAKDRTFQVWKRDSLSIDLFSEKFVQQKMNYIHNNPCQPHWNLAADTRDYRFSSASFYETGMDEFGIITHLDEL
jgi:REP element-mobilizing transposase RayT